MVKVSENTNYDALVRVSGNFLDANKKIIAGAVQPYADHPEVRDGKWRRVVFITDVPAGAEYLRLSLTSRRAVPGKIWFDDVQVKAMP